MKDDGEILDGSADETIINRAIDFLNRSQDAEAENRREALTALEFRGGKQWPPEIQNSRVLEQRPCLTINKIDAFCLQVANQQRQQRPRIKVDPTNNEATKKKAEVIQGMVRHIETTRGGGDLAYDTGFDSAITMGWGYWRVLADYTNDESFDQELYLSAIDNPLACYGDPNSTLPDGSDQEEFLIIDRMSKAIFRKEYPDADDGANFTHAGVGDDMWVTKDDIRIAEYYYIERKKQTLVRLSDGTTAWKDELPAPEVLEQAQVTVAEERPVMRRTVKWCKLTAMDILKSEELKGRYIPVVKISGKIEVIDGKRKYSGLVKNAMDPARMYNFWRPLGLNTSIPTPSGWTTMGAIAVGDTVFNENGQPVPVIGCSPVHINRKCFEITFKDGSKITADAEHPWAVERAEKRVAGGYLWTKLTVRTDEINPRTDLIQVAKPLSLPDADLPIHPYTLGVWLGDGDKNSSKITQSDEDIYHLRDALITAGENVSDKRMSKDRAGSLTIYGLRPKLRALGVLGNKHVPAIYLRASEEQRWALLQGLMDTDGSASNGLCSFTNTNQQLADAFGELTRSLGIKANHVVRSGRIRMWADGRAASEHQDAWQYSFSAHSDRTVFRLARKQQNLPSPVKRHERRVFKHRITSIEEVPSIPVKCIAVDTPSHLFLAGRGMIPTHNTSMTESVALAPKAKWLIAEGQDEGHEEEWTTANTSAKATLRYKTTDVAGQPAPVPQRLQPEPPPTGAMEAASSIAQDLTSVLGIVDPAMRIGGNVSGKALQAEHSQADNSNFHYYDNMTRSIAYTGRILLDLIPYYYSGPRVVRIIGDDGRATLQAINDIEKNDITVGSYDVVMDTGPGYNTKRQEAVDAMMPLMANNEDLFKIAGDLVFRNMDFPGADVIADRLAAANPLAQIDDQSEVPPQAQMKLQQQAAQIQQLTQQLQAAAMEIKTKGGLQQMKEEAETRRTLIETTAKIHANEQDNAAWGHDTRIKDQTHRHDTEVKAITSLNVAEINAAGDLLKTRVNNNHDLVKLDKSFEQSQQEVSRVGAE